MSNRLILIRHADVALRWRGICYGRSDVELSEAGLLQSRELAEQFADRPMELVWHSGAARTRILAEWIASRTGARCAEEPALRERDFGAWEGRSWDDIYAETGTALDGMTLAPDTFRPSDGETTYELRDRVLAWYRSLPQTGFFVAVTHGGPIAALLGTLAGQPPIVWPQLVPAFGAWVELEGEAGQPILPPGGSDTARNGAV